MRALRCDLSPEHPKASGFIYVIKVAEFVKVGMTRRLDGRLAAIIDLNPLDIEVILTRKIPRLVLRQTERAIHDELAAYRHRGEWFRIAPEHAREVALRHVNGAMKAARARLRDERRRAEKQARRVGGKAIHPPSS